MDEMQTREQMLADLQRNAPTVAVQQCGQPQAGEPVPSGYGEFTPIQVGCSTASPQPANPAQVTDAKLHPLEAYADSYAQMARMGDGKVDCRSVEIDIRQNMIPATAAIGAGGQAVAVKPLEWAATKEIRRHLVEGTDVVEYVSKGEFRYTLTKNYQIGSSWDATRGQYTPINQGTCVSFEAAKAAAQADYERRILSALSQPHPADERVVEAWRPIKTAPKDGTKILYRNRFKEIGFCHWDTGINDDEYPCWWDAEADDEVCPVIWLPVDTLPAFPDAIIKEGR